VTIPCENGLAFFPPSRTAGNVTLSPLTLAGAVRLAGLGVDIGLPIPRERVFEVAAVLVDDGTVCDGRARRPAAAAFLRRVKVGLKELSIAVETTLNDAFATYIESAPAKGGTVRLTPHGLGWPLELAEFLCAEYGWRFDDAAATPVARAFALVAAARQRNGGRHKGFDYVERQYAKTIGKHH